MKFKIFICLVMFFSINLHAQDIWNAIDSGDLEKVQMYIEKVGVDVNSIDSYSKTSLLYKAIYGQKDEIANYLIQKKVYIDDNSLRVVLLNGFFKTFNIIIENGFDVNRKVLDGNYIKNTPNDDNIRIKKFSDALNTYGEKALIDESWQKNDPYFEFSGNQYNIIDYSLNNCKERNIFGIIKIIQKVIEINNKSNNKMVIKNKNNIVYKIITNEPDTLREYMKSGNSLPYTAIMSIIITDNIEMFKFIYDIGLVKADSNYVDIENPKITEFLKPMILEKENETKEKVERARKQFISDIESKIKASSKYSFETIYSIERDCFSNNTKSYLINYIKEAPLLLNYEIQKQIYYSYNIYNNDFRITEENFEEMKTLFKNRLSDYVNINMTNNNKDSFLMKLLKVDVQGSKDKKRFLEPVIELVENGININLRNNEDKSALDIAKERKMIAVVKFLESKGAK